MFRLTVCDSFEAAHHLDGYVGKCANTHGHSYKVEVHFLAENLDDLGLGCDFAVLRDKLKQVMDPLDHQYLNKLTCFEGVNPSAENIAKYIFETLSKNNDLPNISVHEVAIKETDHYAATYKK